MNKDELSEKMNELLDLDEEIDFTRLIKTDLEALYEFVSNSSNLIALGVKSLRGKVRKDLLERPLKDLLEVPEDGEDGGPLGLGILPRIRNRRRQG